MAINENIAQTKTAIKFSSKRQERCDYITAFVSFFSMTRGEKKFGAHNRKPCFQQKSSRN